MEHIGLHILLKSHIDIFFLAKNHDNILNFFLERTTLSLYNADKVDKADIWNLILCFEPYLKAEK